MAFSMVERDLDWLERAPLQLRAEGTTGAPPQELWEWLSDPACWPRWFPGMRRAAWIGEPPRQVGSERVVKMNTGTFHERFLVFEPEQHLAFTLTSQSTPFLGSMVESYRLVVDEYGLTEVHVHIGIEPAGWLGWAAPLLRGRLQRMCDGSVQGLLKYAIAHSPTLRRQEQEREQRLADSMDAWSDRFEEMD